jgi:hypothetical protein
MKKRPNEFMELNYSHTKNDLYKKFKKPFDKILNKDFDDFGAYNDKVYVSVDEELEKDIISFFEEYADGIHPLIGSTGIGKTHLVMHVLKSYYQDEHIHANNVFIKEVGSGEYDIILCSAHEKYNNSILKDLTQLLFCRVSTINDKISEKFNLPEIPQQTLDNYIKELKGEILFYNEEPKEYAVQTMRLKYLLSESGINFRNFILIYDDLESLNGESQYILIRDLLALYECLKNRKINAHKTMLKFLFCLRTTTYSNLSLRPDYDTHRVKKPFSLKKYPSLGALFENRFNLCVENFNLLREAGNKDTWKEAKDILMLLSQRLDSCSKDLLIKLNNFNVSDALEDFTKILTNRKWTQKNKNLRQSFKIKEGEYYINNVNIFRVLFMGENEVYVNNTLYSYPTIFLEGRSRQQDFWCLYILMFCSKRYQKYLRTSSYEHLAVNMNEMISIFNNIFIGNKERENEVEEIIKRNINKMMEYKILKKDDFPRDKASLSDRYYISPMGNTIYEEFIKSSILFSIFRDELALDKERYNVKCSCELSQEELYEEFFKYIQEFWQIEKEYFSNVILSSIRKDNYIEYFEDTTIGQKMLLALKDSIHTYYKNDLIGNFRIQEIVESINKLNAEIAEEIKF